MVGLRRDLMDYEEAFRFIFGDAAWVRKILLGGLFYLGSFLLVPLFIVFGYQLKVVRRVGRGEEPPLPDWGNYGELLADGFKLTLVFVIYYSPILVILGAGLGLMIVSLADGLDVLAGFALVGIAFGEIIAVFWSLLMAVVAPAIVMEYARTGQVSSALRVGRIYHAIKKNPSPYFIVVLIAYGLNFVAAIGWIFLFVGVVVTVFFARLITSHLVGQLYRLSLEEREDS